MLQGRRGILGRRIESDGSWTAYHVFTGLPATVDGELMTYLNHDKATSVMLANNDCQHVAPVPTRCF
jgi:hypothetical protein